MNKQLLKDAFGWGFVLWLVGYVLGFIFFFILPPALIGWAILPLGVCITLWVLWKKVKGDSISYFLKLSLVWTVLAVVLDYCFIVQVLQPVDGYYKLDVYVYYALTFVLPLAVGWWKKASRT